MAEAPTHRSPLLSSSAGSSGDESSKRSPRRHPRTEAEALKDVLNQYSGRYYKVNSAPPGYQGGRVRTGSGFLEAGSDMALASSGRVTWDDERK